MHQKPKEPDAMSIDDDWGLSRLLFLDACIDLGFLKRPGVQLLITAVVAFVLGSMLLALFSA